MNRRSFFASIIGATLAAKLPTITRKVTWPSKWRLTSMPVLDIPETTEMTIRVSGVGSFGNCISATYRATVPKDGWLWMEVSDHFAAVDAVSVDDCVLTAIHQGPNGRRAIALQRVDKENQ